MRRWPIYFLIDVSESMIGEPIEQIQNGIRSIIQELRSDPYALETVFVSLIAFAGKAKSLTTMTELYSFYPPQLPIGGGTSLGKALHYLMDDMDMNIQKTTSEIKGDWKPIVFLFTDGTPTDKPESAFARWNNKYRKHCSLVAISIGDNVNMQLLGTITDDVLRLNDTTKEAFKSFFKWITASIKASSVSVSEIYDDKLTLPPVDGINLEKVDTNKNIAVDENFAVMLGKCQNTNRHYLMKYAKRLRPFDGMEQFNATDFKLVGAYTIDEKSYAELSDETKSSRHINTLELVGQPTCPCCGNQFAFVVCQCGNIFCVGDNTRNRCPWCNQGGELVAGDERGMDVNRTRG